MNDLETQFGPIGARLREGLARVDLDGFAERFFAQTIVWRVAGMASAAGDPGLLGRIRGAFGNVLLEGGSAQVLAGEPCPWRPPCAAEMLWRKHGRMTAGTDFPNPWLIAADPHRGDLDVSLTLFGFAGDYAPAAAEAMTAALAKRVDWAGETGLFLPAPRILGRGLSGREGIALSAPPVEAVTLEFLSPATLAKTSPLDDPAPMFATLPLRLAGLARWHGLDLDTSGLPRVKALFARIGWRWRDAREMSWRRGSKKQNASVAMTGVVGALDLSGEAEALSALWPLLAMGEAAHVGADVAFGFGRYAIV